MKKTALKRTTPPQAIPGRNGNTKSTSGARAGTANRTKTVCAGSARPNNLIMILTTAWNFPCRSSRAAAEEDAAAIAMQGTAA